MKELEDEKKSVEAAVASARVIAQFAEREDKWNTRLWIAIGSLCAALLIFAGSMVWAVNWTVNNAQRIANEAVMTALETISEMEVVSETVTTTQTVEGDSATINNVEGEQFNDNAQKYDAPSEQKVVDE